MSKIYVELPAWHSVFDGLLADLPVKTGALPITEPARGFQASELWMLMAQW